MANVKTPAQILRDAAELIRVHGHCKGRYSDDQGRHCAVGAMLAVAGRRTDNTVPHLHGRQALVAFIGQESVGCWNDAPARTPAEVITALESAAASLESA